MAWALVNYFDQKNNVDSKINVAVSEARKTQSAEDEKNFLEREKVPTREFVGPDDLGRVSFQYPKTWSVYVATKSDKSYEAYLHPVVVPTIASTEPYATRVTIEPAAYESVVKAYDKRVSDGKLKSSAITVSGFNGLRFDGVFSKERQGSAVIFKIRDKTLTVASDSTSFRADFDNTILKTLTFVP